jgi:hypothetical protein
MKIVCWFFAKFASLITLKFSCFDRVIFKGHLPIRYADAFGKFVDYELGMRRCDFAKHVAPRWSERLVDHAKQFAKHHGRIYEYHQGNIDKDAWAKAQLHEHGVTEGLIGILCVQEACTTFKLRPAKKRPEFYPCLVPQRVLYYYFLDPDLGLLHVRLQTWAPFTCQIYVNGHEYVAQQMVQRQLGFEQVDNAFVQLDDSAQAQRLADRFANLRWPKILERYARRVNPLLRKELKRLSHYWVTDQAEFATDLAFQSKQALAGLYQRLLEHAWLTFSPKDLFGFLGRKWHGRFDGEVHTKYKSERDPGARVKHFMNGNWLKMYDKFGLILRVETVINRPGAFKVYRECHHRDGTVSLGWYPMCKGVANLPHYQKHALACNQRYLNALAVVDDPTPAYEELSVLTEPKQQQGRSYAGFNPAREEDSKLFAAVLAGDHVARGFRNQDIRRALHGDAKNPRTRRRQSAAIGRQLKRLHVRGLIAKIPHTQRWRITERGRHLLGDTLRTYRRYSSQAA